MPEKELVQIVDSNNTEIGLTTRQEMRAKKLPHRATYILVFNSSGEIFIQKRTKNKDIYPWYFALSEQNPFTPDGLVALKKFLLTPYGSRLARYSESRS